MVSDALSNAILKKSMKLYVLQKNYVHLYQAIYKRSKTQN